MNAPANTASVAALREQQLAPREATLPQVAPGFGSLQSFELMQRQAKLFSSSTLVPAAYRAYDEKKGDNPNALANCVVALNMSQRMGADPLMVMQNLYIVEGRPSWSSQWIIAAINGCGRFSPLRFELKDLGEKEVEYEVTKWVDRQRVTSKHKATVRNMECVAWAIEKETGERITSPAVNIEMAVKEGWYGKSGSKWQTMPEVMLRYRTASFFGKLYAPELLMGLQSVEEAQDILTLDMQADGSYVPAAPQQTIDALRTTGSAANASPVASDAPATEQSVEDAADEAPAAQSHDDPTEDTIRASLERASNVDVLDVAADLISAIPDRVAQDRLVAIYNARRAALLNPPEDKPARTRSRQSGLGIE